MVSLLNLFLKFNTILNPNQRPKMKADKKLCHNCWPSIWEAKLMDNIARFKPQQSLSSLVMDSKTQVIMRVLAKLVRLFYCLHSLEASVRQLKFCSGSRGQGHGRPHQPDHPREARARPSAPPRDQAVAESAHSRHLQGQLRPWGRQQGEKLHLVKLFLNLPGGGDPGIFFIFVYFLST